MRNYYSRNLNYNSNSKWYDHTFNSYNDSVKSFLRKEFFVLDRESLSSIGAVYRKEYGWKAYNYFIDTYDRWKSREVKMSDQTMDRLLRYVPKILNTEKKYQLLKLEILEFIGNYINKFKNKFISTDKIDEAFRHYKEAIDNFNEENLRWFVQDVFDKNEIKDYIEFSKFVLLSKLSLSINSVEHDLRLINQYISKFEKTYFEVVYILDLIGSKVSINGNVEYKTEINININPTHETMLFKNNFKKIIFNNILELSFLSQSSETNGIIQETDLKLLCDSINTAISNNKEFNIHSRLNGKGGLLEINIDYLPKSNIIYAIIVHYISIIGLIIIIPILVYLFVKNVIPKNWKTIYGFVSLAIIFIVYKLVSDQFSKIKEQKAKLKQYKY